MERLRQPPPRAFSLILPLALAVLYVPVFVMLFSSLTDKGALSLRWFREVFEDPELWSALARSLVVAFGSAGCATILGVIGALALDKWLFPARGTLRALSSLSLLLPELVLSLSLLSWFAAWGIGLSLWTVIASHVTLTLPFVILVIGARLRDFDSSLDDAARDLGAGEWRILLHVTLPLLRPAIFTGFLLAFLISFDDFLVTFYTNGAGSDTLPVKLYSLMKVGMSPKIQALSSILLLTSIALIALLMRFFTAMSSRRAA